MREAHVFHKIMKISLLIINAKCNSNCLTCSSKQSISYANQCSCHSIPEEKIYVEIVILQKLCNDFQETRIAGCQTAQCYPQVILVTDVNNSSKQNT